MIDGMGLAAVEMFLGIAAVAGVGGFILWQRMKGTKAQAAIEHKGTLALEADERRILDMQPNDIVTYYDETFIIDARLLYDEEGTVWKTYLLGGAIDGRDRWLSVDDDDRLVVALYEVQPAGLIDVPATAAKTLSHEGISYTLQERGKARVRKHDAMGTRDRGRCAYADYRAPTGERLSVEWWGDNAEVALGKVVREDELMILPGS